MELLAPTRRGTLLSRSTWILSDQALSSLFSLTIGVAAARALPLADFGLFAALFSTLLLARGIVRAVALDPITIRYPGAATAHHARHALATTMATAAAGTLAALATALVNDTFTLPAALASGAALTVLLAIDTSRLLDIAAGNPQRAMETSALLLGASLPLFVAAWFIPIPLPVLLGLTTVAAGVSLALRRPMTSHRPARAGQLAEHRTWLRHQRPLAGPLLLEFLTNTGTLLLMVYLLAWIDLTEAGAFRAAQMVSGPLYMLFTGVTQVVMTEGAQGRRPVTGGGPQDRDVTALVVRRALLLSAVVAVAYLGAVALGQDLLASALKLTDPVHARTLTEIVVLAGLTAPTFVASGLLRALSKPGMLLRARLLSLVPVMVAAVIGAFDGTAAGIVRFGILAQLVNLPMWLYCVHSALRSHRRTPPPHAP